MLWDVFEAHVVGRAWWIDNACGHWCIDWCIDKACRPGDAILLSHSSVDMKALASQEAMADVVADVVGQCRPPIDSTRHLPDRSEYNYE